MSEDAPVGDNRRQLLLESETQEQRAVNKSDPKEDGEVGKGRGISGELSQPKAYVRIQSLGRRGRGDLDQGVLRARIDQLK